ncbi:ABC transporter permease [Sphingobacterium sp. MYb382]|uniref:ABC transporter permease n=1 Tax=Sphingobacterium sp. MYb382 TaxID=2745278 RepID=UPI0030AAC288
MWKFIIKNSTRHLLRNKLFTALNILGLTIGISACWVIYKYTSYELSYESGMPEAKNTYRLVSQFGESGKENFNGGLSRPIFFSMRENTNGLTRVTPVYQAYFQSVRIKNEEKQGAKFKEVELDKQKIIRTDSSYFEMLSYDWLAGNKKSALEHPNQVVLNESRAKIYFPNLSNEDIIGQNISYISQNKDTLNMTVSGVVASLNYNTEFDGEEFILLQKTEKDNDLAQWTNTNGSDRVYFQAKDATSAAHVLKQVQDMVQEKWLLFKQDRKPTFSYNRVIQLLPLKESHFATYLQENTPAKTSKSVIYGLIGVGIFLLLLACINYVNLTTAQLPQRNKEIGIRKTLGSGSHYLIAQMILETALIVLTALILSFFVSKLFIGVLGDLLSAEALAYSNTTTFTLFLTFILSTTLLISGVYPAWMITKVNAIDIFRNKGQVQIGKNKLNFRKGLIVFQFIIAQLFIIGSIIIGQQLSYVLHKDMGFDKDAVIISNIPFKLYQMENFHTKKQTLAEEIRKIPGVQQVSLGTRPLTNGYSSSLYDYKPADGTEPTSVITYLKNIDTQYISLYNLELVAGTNLTPSDTVNGLVVNESAVKAFGFSSNVEALGKRIGQEPNLYPIVGVVKDFHQRDFYNSIDPMALGSNMESANNYNIKLEATQQQKWPEIIKKIEQKWANFFPIDQFEYTFYDESIASLYKKEQQLHTLTNMSTAIAIFISCLGLFGLATITAFQRSKEIGIRKVLGASITSIVGMLSKDFVKMVFIALLVAAPIVWWFSHNWLADFTYRIEISWLPFAAGGLVACFAALLTVSYQAIKAAKTNPVDSLRDE